MTTVSNWEFTIVLKIRTINIKLSVGGLFRDNQIILILFQNRKTPGANGGNGPRRKKHLVVMPLLLKKNWFQLSLIICKLNIETKHETYQINRRHFKFEKQYGPIILN